MQHPRMSSGESDHAQLTALYHVVSHAEACRLALQAATTSCEKLNLWNSAWFAGTEQGRQRDRTAERTENLNATEETYLEWVP